MKLTIIVYDGFVAVDGVGYSGLDLSFMDSTIHAIQFNGTKGWIEYVMNEDGEKPNNQPIVSIDEFQPAIDAWNIADQAAKEALLNPATPIIPVGP